MRVAIVHYHLRPGGVTRVIESAVEALRDRCEVVILTGEAPPAESPLAPFCRVVPGLSYRDSCDSGFSDLLASELESIAGEAPDVWHFHNHSLGKNVALPGAVRSLAESGARLLLQIHDFAEDGRPENYQNQTHAPATVLYPSAPQIHYAVINRRDRDILRGAGLDVDCLHLLPNAVGAPPKATEAGSPDFAKGKTFFLYPTRGIRRKNIGELLLLSALAGDRYAWATTLAPENPRWQRGHDRWAALAGRLGLPVKLGISEDGDFSAYYSAANAIVTTSVAEGFGFAFLEPWLAGKRVVGRGLTEIVPDAIDLGHLYPRLDAPVRWIDSNRLHEKLDLALRSAFSAYGRDLPDDAIEKAYMSAVRGGRVDFGRLDEELQEIVIEKAIADPGAIDLPDLVPGSAESIAENAHAVERNFGLAAYGERLGGIYDRLMESPSTAIDTLNSGAILDAFLDTSRFHLLLT
jgi:glycosyltransferase involved in cell wall biosynthesis